MRVQLLPAVPWILNRTSAPGPLRKRIGPKGLGCKPSGIRHLMHIDHVTEQVEAALTESFIQGSLHDMNAKEVHREHVIRDDGGLQINVTGLADLPVKNIGVTFQIAPVAE
jgi:hypothetical protein